jgi:hypothetical protein
MDNYIAEFVQSYRRYPRAVASALCVVAADKEDAVVRKTDSAAIRATERMRIIFMA